MSAERLTTDLDDMPEWFTRILLGRNYEGDHGTGDLTSGQ